MIGRAVGATLGQAIDRRILGAGAEPVETGRIDRFRLMGAEAGEPVARVWGRARVAGQLIWSTRFLEEASRSGGGKGSRPARVDYSYSVSIAVALCEGEIAGIGRIWADGQEIEPSSLTLRVYTGSETQLPDPRIEAVEGQGHAPAYRGIAYVVIEDLALGRFGNRLPQLNFEVMRPAQGEVPQGSDLGRAVPSVALIPGTGEYALATSPVHYAAGPGEARSANVNSASGETDFATSLAQLRGEVPECKSVGLIVSWFGTDLRCGECEVRPLVEQREEDGANMPWVVAGQSRASAELVPKVGDAPVYGGTPADASVIEAIRALREAGKEVMFYPFILMDQLQGNTKPDPWTGGPSQAALPWRGRITTSLAPGLAGTPDTTAAAVAEVAAFFGTSQPGQFTQTATGVSYSGPAEWRYRRFILHYANLCKVAGGVEAFCIGSEMRALTQIRGPGHSFPAVTQLRQLAAEVRAILGPGCKISYAADWSEYFGYHVGSNVYFHLDPLWADSNVDFIGIDNYMPLADWRDGVAHADAAWGSIYNLEYLMANIAGGEGFDWYYDGPEGEAAQNRKPITDGAYGEPWVYRYKDLKSWWGEPHHERIGGVRSATQTAWVPKSKPIRFTEYGCAAIDKGANQPNRFLDPKSSESGLPRASTGRRDDLMQMQYLRAMDRFWRRPANNPTSPHYPGRMVDWSRAHAWAWDARPFPAFPGRDDLWADAENYLRGHWLNGRVTSAPLDGVIAEICSEAGLSRLDVGAVYGLVRGYPAVGVTTPRALLQPLLLAHPVDVAERDGLLAFTMRTGRADATLDTALLAVGRDGSGAVEVTRAAEAELTGWVRLGHITADGDFEAGVAEAIAPDDERGAITASEVPLVLTQGEARAIAERWLAEARVGRDMARFRLPPSVSGRAGQVYALEGGLWRADRVALGEAQEIEAVRVEPGVFIPADETRGRQTVRRVVSPVPVSPIFLDLPLMTGDEVPYAPFVGAAANPWPGPVGVWTATGAEGFRLDTTLTNPALMGVTLTPLRAARPGLWDNGPALRLRMAAGGLVSVTENEVLSGANLAAIGPAAGGGPWEVFQYRQADLVGTRTWELRARLRGQFGSDADMPEEWPVGSLVVFLDASLRQVNLPASLRGVARRWRVGVLARGAAHPTVEERTLAFDGIGLRPYRVAHLRVVTLPNGSRQVSWIRRGRIDADSWQGSDIPLGEETEAYLLRVIAGGSVVREVEVTQPSCVYTAAQGAADGVSGAFEIAVAQVSARFGPGPFQTVSA